MNERRKDNRYQRTRHGRHCVQLTTYTSRHTQHTECTPRDNTKLAPSDGRLFATDVSATFKVLLHKN